MKKKQIYAIISVVVLVIFGTLAFKGHRISIKEEAKESNTPPSSIVSASYSDGKLTVVANYDISNKTVSFNHPSVGTITLPIAISGSGARYANEDESLVFWEHQDELTITRDGVEIFRGLKQ